MRPTGSGSRGSICGELVPAAPVFPAPPPTVPLPLLPARLPASPLPWPPPEWVPAPKPALAMPPLPRPLLAALLPPTPLPAAASPSTGPPQAATTSKATRQDACKATRWPFLDFITAAPIFGNQARVRGDTGIPSWPNTSEEQLLGQAGQRPEVSDRWTGPASLRGWRHGPARDRLHRAFEGGRKSSAPPVLREALPGSAAGAPQQRAVGGWATATIGTSASRGSCGAGVTSGLQRTPRAREPRCQN